MLVMSLYFLSLGLGIYICKQTPGLESLTYITVRSLRSEGKGGGVVCQLSVEENIVVRPSPVSPGLAAGTHYVNLPLESAVFYVLLVVQWQWQCRDHTTQHYNYNSSHGGDID